MVQDSIDVAEIVSMQCSDVIQVIWGQVLDYVGAVFSKFFMSVIGCYVNHDSNNWHFCANLSSGVLSVWDGDLAHIDNMQKPDGLAALS